MNDTPRVPPRVTVRASPSLALIKYWGKLDTERNLPATPSLAVTLDRLFSTTTVTPADADRVYLDGVPGDPHRYFQFFDTLRARLGTSLCFSAESTNSFPTAAGLASSASGFAALVCACARAAGVDAADETLSAIARVGSASAARSLYGGFVGLDAGAEAARPIHPASHWPEFRIIVVAVTTGPKHTSSRSAMDLARSTSPYYREWVSSSAAWYAEALEALAERDITRLGGLMRSSYLAMFSTMFTSNPPVIYWLPGSLEVIKRCEELRAEGIPAWETMDAGPQVKIACEAPHVEAIIDAIDPERSGWQITVAAPGAAPEIIEEA